MEQPKAELKKAEQAKTEQSVDVQIEAFTAAVGDSEEVAIEGNRTRWELGGQLRSGVRRISAPIGMADYSPAEMTVRVGCGTLVSDLHNELAKSGQRTALAERGGTVGGAIAVGENHVGVLGRGRLRDAVLKVRYVSAEGRIVSGGGPTVKNVSGFDLPRLMVGSLGTLGCLADVIIRTNPTPQQSQWLRSTDVDPFAVQSAVYRPGCILWDGSSTWVLLEGSSAAVEVEQAKLSAVATFEPVESAPRLPDHRWSVDPDAMRSPAQFGKSFVASIGVGTVWADQPQSERHIDPNVEQIASRLKANFDPTNRLNPGREPGRR